MKRLITAVIAVLALALPASAMAKDRNHDKLPDKWEKRHHLSLHHNQARRDQDRDGLRNLAEYRQHTDPRDDDSDEDGIEDGDEHKLGHDPSDDDSDNDGVEDGDENTGTVKSFDGTTLVITLAKGGEVSGLVTDATELKCNAGDDEGDDHGEDSGDHSGSGDQGDDEGDDHGDDAMATASSDDGDTCSDTSLAAGAVVREAELEVANGQAVWHEVKLLG